MSERHDAWQMLCKLFRRPGPTAGSLLTQHELTAVAYLQALRAVGVAPLDASFVLCPTCRIRRVAPAADEAELDQWTCDCKTCGRVDVRLEQRLGYVVDVRWLAAQLRMAVGQRLEGTVTQLDDAIWHLGWSSTGPVVLARAVEDVIARPRLMSKAGLSATDALTVIAPASGDLREDDQLDDSIRWLPLQHRFALYGSRVHRIDGAAPNVRPMRVGVTAPSAVYGIFSSDFRCAQWEGEALPLSRAQAAIMRVLWNYRGTPVTGVQLLRDAGLKGTKPGDVFKVKPHDQHSPRHQAVRQLYHRMVDIDRRQGTYSLRDEPLPPTA